MSGSVGGIDRRETVAAAVGGLLGAAVLGGILRVGRGPGEVVRFAGVVGADGEAVGWATVAVVCLVLSAGFGAFLSATASPFVDGLFGLTRRSDRLRRLLMPVVANAAYLAAASTLGLAYGLLAGLVVGALAVPAAVVALGGTAPVPALDPVALVGWVAYGVVVGVVYARITDGGR